MLVRVLNVQYVAETTRSGHESILHTPPLKDGLLWKAIFAGHPYFLQGVLGEFSGRCRDTVIRAVAAVVHCALLFPCVCVRETYFSSISIYHTHLRRVKKLNAE